MSIPDFLGKEILYFDGAMGTRLQAAGMKPGELPEVWNITHGDIVADIHASYVRAGANILKSNTFGANAMKLQGSGYSVEEVVLAAFENARKAFRDAGRAGQSVPGVSEDKQFTALDLGPTGKLLAPFGDLQFEDAVALYAETVRAGVKAKADLILIETMSDTYEAKAAILAAKENSDLPIFVTFTFDKDGKLLNGADVETAVLMAEGLGVDAVGFNCGLGPDLVAKLMPRARAVTCLPLIANPNAGLPVEKEGKTVFTTGPEDFAEYMLDVYKEGASVLGGCCGTNPEYIRLVAERTQGLQPVQAAVHGCGAAGKGMQTSGIIPADKDSTAFCIGSVTAVTGYGAPVYFGKQPVLIGERINPTGKPLLKDALRNNDMDYVCRLGLEQLDCGAHILDVNTGLPGLDEAVTLAGAVTGLQAVTPAPLEIDTSNYEAMEKALRLYNGKPLLNSVNGKKESMEKVFPLAKKYGAAVVGLCLDETGIPDTAEGRLAIAEKILATASDYGIQSKDIIIDPLALTVSTDSRNPAIDIAVIKVLKEKGIHTVMGVSNISFGLPNRDGVNSTFFAMSLAAGLSSAIMNPQSDRMMETYRAFCALSGADEGCKDFVARYADAPKTKAAAAVSEYTLYDAIVKGLAEQSGTATKKLLEEKTAPLDIINNFIIPALNTVGEGFGKKTLFLPQLLMAADAAKAAFDELKKQMQAGGTESSTRGDTIVLAVVKGDIHDIGKNIVKVLWENYGYHVVDLGKDVPAESVVEAVEKHQAKLVGLTALMTTTVAAMEETISALRDATDTKILVGGAVMTQEYADTIGADGYAPDAVAAVDYANRIFREEKE